MGLADDLERLASLHAAGELSDAEYQSAKQAALSGDIPPSGGPGPTSPPDATPVVQPSGDLHADTDVRAEGRPPLWERLDRRGRLIFGGVAVGVVLLAVVAVAVASGGDSGAGGLEGGSVSSVDDLHRALTDGGFTCPQVAPSAGEDRVEFKRCTHDGHEVVLSVVTDSALLAEVAELVGGDAIAGENWLVSSPFGSQLWDDIVDVLGGEAIRGGFTDEQLREVGEESACTMQEYVENDGCP
jgi:hypothetical protein